MKKSVSKRIRVTKNGKMVRRPMAIDHFRTRNTQKNIRGKSKMRTLDIALKRIINY